MSTVQRRIRRSGQVAALLLLATALIAPAANASPESDAATWLSESPQLKSAGAGEKYCEQFGSPSVGQTIDCMIAFDAAVGFTAEENETWNWILANKNSYVGSAACTPETTSMSAGAVAKLALGAAIHGVDPTAVGGRNLIADLQCLQDTGTEKGRFKDRGEFGDFSNVFGQSLAMVAIEACVYGKVTCANAPAELTKTMEEAGSYLRGQQCTKNGSEPVVGAYRSSMGLAPNTCNAKPILEGETFNENAIEVDSTGVAVEALWREGKSAKSKTAAENAAKWGWSARIEKTAPKRIYWENYCQFGSTEKFPSVNSTALAIMGAAEISYEIGPAKAWLADTVENGGDDGMPACGETGSGDVIATAQGILGLVGTSYPKLVGF